MSLLLVEEPVTDFLSSFLWLCCVYYVGGAILHCVVPSVISVRSVQKNGRPKGQVWRDAGRSLGPILVKALVWSVTKGLYDSGNSRLYLRTDYTLRAAAYDLFAVLVLDLVHDAWFYLTHRLLHLKPAYRHIHFSHHQSRVPSAFSGYSFHVVEALIVFANEILVCFVFPLDLRLHRLYHLLSTLIHQGGHVGYEFSPCQPMLSNLVLYALLPRSWWSWMATHWMNTVQHHDMHHVHVSCHFSLYYTHWDRLFCTLHPSYDATLGL